MPWVFGGSCLLLVISPFGWVGGRGVDGGWVNGCTFSLSFRDLLELDEWELTSRHEKDSSTHLDKWSRWHSVSSNSHFDLHRPWGFYCSFWNQHGHVLCPNFVYCLSGGGFILTCQDFGRIFHYSFPACNIFFFFLKWRLAHAHLFHSSCLDQSTVAQWTEMTVDEPSLTSCGLACFFIGLHGQRHCQPTWTSSGQGCMRT